MRMFRWGVEGGRPASRRRSATPPEWFYKGVGTILRAHGEPLDVPTYAEDGGEEAEIAGVYLMAPDGRRGDSAWRSGNEFSDHQFEKKNYLNLAGSKIRTCSLGPELVVDPDFTSVSGRAHDRARRRRRSGRKEISTGEAEMCHSLRTSNITTSSSKPTAVPATSTCTTTAPAR